MKVFPEIVVSKHCTTRSVAVTSEQELEVELEVEEVSDSEDWVSEGPFDASVLLPVSVGS